MTQYEKEAKEIVAARHAHVKELAAVLRRAAEAIEREGMPIITNHIPGWGDVVLLVEQNTLQGNDKSGMNYNEAILDWTGGKIQVLVGPGGINNCYGVLVLPVPGMAVRVRAEKKA